MLSGPQAAKKVCDYGGATVHRRSMIMANLVVDFHLRVAQHLVGTSAFSTLPFMHALGAELGKIDPAVYDEFVEAYAKSARGRMNGGELTKIPVFFDFSVGDKNSAMYRALGSTKLFSLLRCMMGMLLPLLVIGFNNNILGEDFSSFMDLQLAYSEPMLQKDGVRMMFYLRTRLSIMTGVPFRSPLVAPQVTPEQLNGSL